MLVIPSECYVKPEREVTVPASVSIDSPHLREKLEWRKGDGDTVYGKRPFKVDELVSLRDELDKFLKYIYRENTP